MIKLIKIETIFQINKEIENRPSSEREYSGSKDYPIKVSSLKKMIQSVPIDKNIDEIAAYYLKNIILLQSFPDANHRTALFAAEYFLENNGYKLSYTIKDAIKFQKDLYKIRLQVFGSYEEQSVKILNKFDDSTFILCLKFIRDHMSYVDHL